MGFQLFIEKISPRELVLHRDGETLLRIKDRVVFQGAEPLWQIVHQGADMFCGTWQILAVGDRRLLASYRYISTSYRYGEDLRIRCPGVEAEFLFRRVHPEQDRWLLLSSGGDVLLEASASSGPTGPWELRSVGSLEDRLLYPVICLLTFDRLVSGRI